MFFTNVENTTKRDNFSLRFFYNYYEKYLKVTNTYPPNINYNIP